MQWALGHVGLNHLPAEISTRDEAWTSQLARGLYEPLSDLAMIVYPAIERCGGHMWGRI
jgi:hypothetical protein